MDWGFIFERTFSAMIGIEVVVFALAAVGLNVHFGYAGLLNFGQVGFMAAGAYGLGDDRLLARLELLGRHRFGIVYSVVLRPDPRLPDAAAARRLSRRS